MTTRIRRARVPSNAPGAAVPVATRGAGKSAAVDLTEKVSPKNPLATSTTPHLPHERDEVVGATGAVPSERVRQGYRDLTRGMRDTSRATEADATYDKLKE